jgi:hypothetical protein
VKKVLLYVFLALLATTGVALPPPAKAQVVVSLFCWPRLYCGIYGPPIVQQCANPIRARYCERTWSDGTIHWWWD